MNSVTTIDYRNQPDMRAAAVATNAGWLVGLDHGYVVAFDDLTANDLRGNVAILRRNDAHHMRGILGRIFNVEALNLHVATIKMDPSKHELPGVLAGCLVQVFGRSELPAIEQLAKHLSTEFNCDVAVQLVQEQPMDECLSRDRF